LISRTIEELGDFDPFFPQNTAKRLDMRPKMVGRHEIQIMHALEKKRPNFRKKFLGCDHATIVLDRDLIVLAKKTLAGTAAKEDRPGPLGSRKGRLFPKMSPYKRNAAD
jgi:hypothetical protein